jgi:predicted ArsR family transcriptional regulator
MPDGFPTVAAADDVEQRQAALAVRSRRRILELVRSVGRPVPIAELAAAVGLHVTTARAHLRVLEAAGLVVRTSGPPDGRGRPRHFYAPVIDESSGEGHRQLAELLAGALGGDDDQGPRRAEDAGRRWAERQVADAGQLSWEQAVVGIGNLFSRLGFAPRQVDAGRPGYRLALERCPFRDVARAHPEVVCAVHLGLMRGALVRSGLPAVAEAARLKPFVAPELCLAEVPEPRRPAGVGAGAGPTVVE